MASILFGKCLGRHMKSTVKVLVPSLKLDTFFNMYFRENQKLLVDTNQLNCEAGDWLIIKKLEQPLSLRVNHRVETIVYKAGHVVDPLTGRQSLGYEYVSDKNDFRKRMSH